LARICGERHFDDQRFLVEHVLDHHDIVEIDT